MKVLVTPVEGCGWYSSGPPSKRLDVPDNFHLDVKSPAAASPPQVVVGMVEDPAHLLGGLWVLLERCWIKDPEAYALRAFMEDPSLIPRRAVSRMQPAFSGFAELQVMAGALRLASNSP